MVRLKATAQFQSTLPAGEATIKGVYNAMDINISIHASREGSDRSAGSPHDQREAFQSTLPAREATRINIVILRIKRISIHASREGSDQWYGSQKAKD